MGRKRMLPTSKQAEILNVAAKAGYTMAQAAKLAECTMTEAENWAKDNGVKFSRRSGKKLTPDDVQMAIDLREYGEPVPWSTIASQLGVAESTIREAVKKATTPVPPNAETENATESAPLNSPHGGEIVQHTSAILIHAEAVANLAEAVANLTEAIKNKGEV